MSQKEETIRKLSQLKEQSAFNDAVQDSLDLPSGIEIDVGELSLDRLGTIGEALGKALGALIGRRIGEALGRELDLGSENEALVNSLLDQVGSDESADGDDGSEREGNTEESTSDENADGDGNLNEKSTEELQSLADELMNELDERSES